MEKSHRFGHSKKTSIPLCVVAFLLASCGGSGSDSSVETPPPVVEIAPPPVTPTPAPETARPITIQGVVMAGPAACSVRIETVSGETISDTNTRSDSTGSFETSVSDYLGIAVIKAENCTYENEIDGAQVNNQDFQSIIEFKEADFDNVRNISVTPITSVAYQKAITSVGGQGNLDSSIFERTNSSLSKLFSAGSFDISKTVPISAVDTRAVHNNVGATTYGLFLAVLSALDDPDQAIRALSDDVSLLSGSFSDNMIEQLIQAAVKFDESNRNASGIRATTIMGPVRNAGVVTGTPPIPTTLIPTLRPAQGFTFINEFTGNGQLFTDDQATDLIYVVSGLPEGLEQTTNTIIQGRVDTLGEFRFFVTAYDDDGNSSIISYRIIVSEAEDTSTSEPQTSEPQEPLIPSAIEAAYNLKSSCTASRPRLTTFGATQGQQSHATEIVSDNGEVVFGVFPNVSATGINLSSIGNNLEDKNVRIKCSYTYAAGNNASRELYDFELYQFLPLKNTFYWEKKPTINSPIFMTSPISDLHYKIYLEKLDTEGEWEKALVETNKLMESVFPGGSYLPVPLGRSGLFRTEPLQVSNEERLLGLARDLTDTNVSTLTSLIADNSMNCTIPILCVSIFGEGAGLLKNANFEKSLDDWNITQTLGDNASGSVSTSFSIDGTKALTLQLISNRPSNEARPVIAVSQDYAVGEGELENLFVKANIETVQGIEGSIALFSGTGFAGLIVSFYDGEQWVGETVHANFADSGGLSNIPFIRASPVDPRSTANTQIVKIPSIGNSGFVIDLDKAIKSALPDVNRRFDQIDRITVSAFATDFDNVTDVLLDNVPGTATRICRDCRAVVKLKSLDVIKFGGRE